MLQSIPVVDKTNNYQLYIGMHPEDHVVLRTFSKSFFPFSDTSHHAAMSSQQNLMMVQS